MACRFVLGVGVGGKYPLAATIRAEACTDGEVSRHSATEVAKGFFWQTCATTHHIRLQPASHTVAASITYGCSPHHIRLQPPSHTVAGRARCCRTWLGSSSCSTSPPAG